MTEHVRMASEATTNIITTWRFALGSFCIIGVFLTIFVEFFRTDIKTFVLGLSVARIISVGFNIDVLFSLVVVAVVDFLFLDVTADFFFTVVNAVFLAAVVVFVVTVVLIATVGIGKIEDLLNGITGSKIRKMAF